MTFNKIVHELLEENVSENNPKSIERPIYMVRIYSNAFSSAYSYTFYTIRTLKQLKRHVYGAVTPLLQKIKTQVVSITGNSQLEVYFTDPYFLILYIKDILKNKTKYDYIADLDRALERPPNSYTSPGEIKFKEDYKKYKQEAQANALKDQGYSDTEHTDIL